MRPTDSTPDPLLSRLGELRRDALDEVTASRTLARAEAAFVASSGAAPTGGRSWRPALVPAALALWGALYVWGAVGELHRLFPGGAGQALTTPTAALRSPTTPMTVAARMPRRARP